MRRILILLAGSMVMLLVSAGSAWAQQYPPSPAGAGQGAGGGGGEFAVTGSETMPLVWIGLATLVAGIVLVLAARRRAGVRGRARDTSEAIA
ncbi:MAG: LPXTG cell wall anchor domain-containing protein [Actinomycetota bacterium]